MSLFSSLFYVYLSYIHISIGCPSGYSYCATQGGTCSQSGVIAFGYSTRYTYDISTGSIPCTTTRFGNPYPGPTKECCCLAYTYIIHI